MGNNDYKALNGVVILILSLFIFSCSPDPADTIEQYLELTYINNNAKKAYSLLSRYDLKFKSE